MLSIIIPTLNEEKSLSLLLKSIKKQEFADDYEIIVADANSIDGTTKIAKSYGCRILEGGSSPAKGKNNGAKAAKGNILLFIDADAILPANFLYQALKEFKQRNLDVASFCLKPRTPQKFKILAFNIFYNWPILMLERIIPHASQVILVKKDLHNRNKGFDESIKLAEDHSYVRKAKNLGKYGIIHSVRILSSLRRFEKDGWIRTYLRYILAETHMLLIGDIRGDIFRYRFNHYK